MLHYVILYHVDAKYTHKIIDKEKNACILRFFFVPDD